jgi:hypothetical protein
VGASLAVSGFMEGTERGVMGGVSSHKVIASKETAHDIPLERDVESLLLPYRSTKVMQAGGPDVESLLQFSRSNKVEIAFLSQGVDNGERGSINVEHGVMRPSAKRVKDGGVTDAVLHVVPQPMHAQLSLRQPSCDDHSQGQVPRTTCSWKKSARKKEVDGVAPEPVTPPGKQTADALGVVVRSVHKGKKGKKSEFALSLVDEVEAEVVSQPRHHQ